jgi:hypothetical protein
LSPCRRSLSIAPALLLIAACGEVPPPAPVVAPAPPVAVAPPAPPARAEPYLRVLLSPRVDPAKIVHVEIELAATAPLGIFRLLLGAPEGLSHVTLSDAAGPIETKLSADGAGVVLTPARAPSGVTRLAYDVVANVDSPFDPFAERVLDDRFVGSGEGLLLLPEGVDDELLPVELLLDGAPLRAPNGASTLGIGARHRTKARPRSLRHVAFLLGSLGGAVFDTAGEHDEAAWLGYTAFDPRPVAAEVAQVRSAMAELFHEHDQEHDERPWTLLLATQTRPVGSYSTTPRSGGVLVELGPSEPWSAALRVSVAQQLVRPWIGGELWLGPREAGATSYWFTEGVARFFVTRMLARLGLLRPDDVRDALVGESSVVITSRLKLAARHADASNIALASRAATDAVARAHLVARGALYAARINALVREKSKGASSLDTIILELLREAKKSHQPLPLTAWTDAVASMLGPSEVGHFDDTINRGEEVVLPKGVLGHCYRAGTGQYVAFDLGFDGAATQMSKTGEVVGLEPGGPAERAGVKPGDVIDADYRDGHSEVPVVLTVKRGTETLHLKYAPKGVTYRGPTWTRVPGTPDDQCTDAW